MSRFLFPQRYLVYAILWSLSGDSRLKMRAELGEYIRRITTVPLPAAPNIPIIDYEVSGPRARPSPDGGHVHFGLGQPHCGRVLGLSASWKQQLLLLVYSDLCETERVL